MHFRICPFRTHAAAGVALILLFAGSTTACAQSGALSKFGQAATALAPASRSTSEQVIPKEEVAQGLQEALVKGAGEAVGLLGKTSGFAKSPIYRIPLPPEAERLRAKIDANPVLKAAVAPQLDATVERMNEGAEKAVAKALPIFKRAILSMTFADAYGILRGGNRAATDYLIRTTGPTLRATFKPEVEAALQEAEIARKAARASARQAMHAARAAVRANGHLTLAERDHALHALDRETSRMDDAAHH
jgi:hypothetical protein